MPVSTIDGTIETATLKRKAGKVSVYDTVLIRQKDGTEATLKKIQAVDPVASALQPGVSGRFYTFSAFDSKGVHGLRTADGQSLFGFPANNEKIMLIVLILAVVMFGGWFVLDNRIALLPAGLIILGGLGYFFYRKGRIDATRQFEADAGYRAA